MAEEIRWGQEARQIGFQLMMPGTATFVDSNERDKSFHWEFVSISAGDFHMGVSPGDTVIYLNEAPRHRVRISHGFEIGRYPVTQAMWEEVMANNPSRHTGLASTFRAALLGKDRPVEQVSWHDAQEFLKRLNASQREYSYRLPTEAEWEYAARAGSTSAYYGDPESIGWTNENSYDEPHPVGQKQPNAWGLYDVLGNVWEWVEDWYDDDYYKASPTNDPKGPSNGSARTARGGAFTTESRAARLSRRDPWSPESRSYTNGFRCVRHRL